MDVDRAEMRMAKSEQARIEADQRYNEMVDKYRQLQNSIIDGNVLSPQRTTISIEDDYIQTEKPAYSAF